jgi:hypothetical protein
MIFGLWTKNGALNSAPVFSSFADGLIKTGHQVVYNTEDCDVEVIWSVLWSGRMAQNKPLWHRSKRQQKPIIVLEVGGINRGKTWKMGINGIDNTAIFPRPDPLYKRAGVVGLNPTPWNFAGKNILICAQNENSDLWTNKPKTSVWLESLMKEIRRVTDRPVVFRPHPRFPVDIKENTYKNFKVINPTKVLTTYDSYDLTFDDVYATINPSSNPGTQSVINGVKALVDENSLAYDMSIKTVNNLLSDREHDRENWIEKIAYTEFYLSEFADGIPQQMIREDLEKLIIKHKGQTS